MTTEIAPSKIERAAAKAGIDVRHHYDECGLTLGDLNNFVLQLNADNGAALDEYEPPIVRILCASVFLIGFVTGAIVMALKLS